MQKPNKDLYIRYEIITTLLWFVLDASWLFGWRWVANTFAVLATLAALLTVLYAERDASNLAAAFGVLGWVLMNAFWVTGDINGMPWGVPAAKVCAGGVLVCLVVAIWVSRMRDGVMEVLGRIRRFKF